MIGVIEVFLSLISLVRLSTLNLIYLYNPRSDRMY